MNTAPINNLTRVLRRESGLVKALRELGCGTLRILLLAFPPTHCMTQSGLLGMSALQISQLYNGDDNIYLPHVMVWSL